VRVRARSGRGRVFMGAGGRLGAREVTTTTRARVERSRHGRRRAPLRRPMARRGRCADRWIGAIWRGPLATDVTGELPLAQRSDQRSLQRLGVRPTQVQRVRRVADVAAHDDAAGRVSGVPSFCISLKQFSN
jgi:hypothetical protein